MKVCWRGRMLTASRARAALRWDYLRGDALCESLLVSEGRPRHFQAHARRLREEARALGFPVPDFRALLRQCRSLVRCNRLRQGQLRLRCFRDGSVLVFAQPLRQGGPLRLTTSAWRHAGPESFSARAKTSSMLASLTTLAELPSAGEALRLTPQGRLAEGAWRNLLIRRRGRWLSPPAWEGLLEGTALARRSAHRLPLTRYDLYTAEEAWALNALGCWRVLEADGRSLSAGRREP